MGRVTIADVARAAGVSKGAASHALNGMPGVSEATRARVQAVAEQLQWTPNSVARALSGSRVGAIGWAIQRTGKSASIDPYFMELFAGIEDELAGTDVALVVKLVTGRGEETGLYRRWGRERRVDGVLLLDYELGDTRADTLDSIGLPYASARSRTGDAAEPSALTSLSPAPALTLWTNESAVVAATLGPVAGHGHRRVLWVSGDSKLEAITRRAAAAADWAAMRGIELATVFTDFSPGQGAAAALDAVTGDAPPTCIVLDNDLMALAAQTALVERGFSVPADVSLLSFIDSALCQIASPALAAMRHTPQALGRVLTRCLLDKIDPPAAGDRGKAAAELGIEFLARASLGVR